MKLQRRNNTFTTPKCVKPRNINYMFLPSLRIPWQWKKKKKNKHAPNV